MVRGWWLRYIKFKHRLTWPQWENTGWWFMRTRNALALYWVRVLLVGSLWETFIFLHWPYVCFLYCVKLPEQGLFNNVSNIVWFCLYERSKTGKFLETQSRSVFVTCWGVITTDGHGVPFGGDIHVLGLDRGDGYKTLWMHKTLNCTFLNAQNVCVFYHKKKISIWLLNKLARTATLTVFDAKEDPYAMSAPGKFFRNGRSG